MHRLQPILEQALRQKRALPDRKITCLEGFIERVPEVKRVILDGTERPIKRSTDRERQKQDDSGKKKRHPRSHLATAEASTRILILGQSYTGKDHDKGILNYDQWVGHIPSEVKIQGVLGCPDFSHYLFERKNYSIFVT